MRRTRYEPPSLMKEISIPDLLGRRRLADDKSEARLTLPGIEGEKRASVYYAGRIELAKMPSVAIVGSRKVSDKGAQRARRLARSLVEHGVVVVSGLAEGVDHNAHVATLEAGGNTIAVIGTPLDKAYPAKHAELQTRIYRDHLLVSPFRVGSRVFPSNFPQRNRLMAAMSDATVIIEAGETSGSLSQAKECTRIGRWLFIARSVIESGLKWPERFLGEPFVKVLGDVDDVVQVLPRAD